jgi:RHS repeat-associated protein
VTGTENPPVAFGATYDDAGRIETVTYVDGLFTVTYQYDSRDLLTQVTDSRTGTTISFTYDNDGRVTGITRSNGVGSTYTWDDASRLTRMQHNTVADLHYQYNAAGEVTQLDYTLPLDPTDYLTANPQEFTYDDASQISSAGYSYDTRGRQTASPTETFTWDGASRLTGTGTATLEYNGLGDLMKRTAGGTTTHYYYNYALDLSPIVAEKDEVTGEWKRFYVLAPTGHLLYMIDASDSDKVYFYHYDRTGNTLFLTGASGTVTDSYAYTPYGKLLDHEGTNEQPFTFGGSYQARAEGNNLYQMRARYYDANTARFISREPLWPQIADGTSINPYQYAFQNPLLYVDRTGLGPVGANPYVDFLALGPEDIEQIFAQSYYEGGYIGVLIAAQELYGVGYATAVADLISHNPELVKASMESLITKYKPKKDMQPLDNVGLREAAKLKKGLMLGLGGASEQPPKSMIDLSWERPGTRQEDLLYPLRYYLGAKVEF